VGATVAASGELGNRAQAHGSDGKHLASGVLMACLGASLLFAGPGCGHANQGEAGMVGDDMQEMESAPAPTYYCSDAVTPVGGPGTGCARGMMGSGEPCGTGWGTCCAEMMGSGMMGYHGHRGMMAAFGLRPIMRLDLSDAQRGQLNKATDALRQQQWATMGKIMEEQSKLRDLEAMAEPDPKQVGEVYGAIAKLRQEMIVAQVKAHNEAVALLTSDQREQLKRWERGGWGPSGSTAGQPSPPPPVPPPPPPVGQREVPPPPPH
jgi:Spy/CpxP family protein refolding chaperone